MPLGKRNLKRFSRNFEAQFEIYGAGLKYAASPSFAFPNISRDYDACRIWNISAQNYDIPVGVYYHLKANIAEWEKEKNCCLKLRSKRSSSARFQTASRLLSRRLASVRRGHALHEVGFVLGAGSPPRGGAAFANTQRMLRRNDLRIPYARGERGTADWCKARIVRPVRDVANMYNVPNVRERRPQSRYVVSASCSSA